MTFISHKAGGPGALFRRGLTLIEMTVAVALLVVVILGVGLIFQHASAAVGVSQRTLEILSNVRSVQTQLERDISGIDKNCFLVIRGSQFQDPTLVWHRSDLIS